MAIEAKKQAKLGKFFKASKKVLIRLRDLYIQSMLKCEENINSYSGAMSGPAAQFPTVVPRSFSTSSYASTRSNEDLRELFRIASARSLGGKVEAEVLQRHQSPKTGKGVKVVPWSASVAIGRIDEDKPSEFEGEVKVKTYLYPRSRSVVVKKNTGIV